jgi:hypothetical protein
MSGMAFETVYVYNNDGAFLGYGIKNSASQKLHTMNLWTEDQIDNLEDQLQRLNERTGILAHWPMLGDPEVQVLLNDPTWEPVANEPVEIVDEDKSTFVWIRKPDLANGDVGEMNEDASDIVFKTVMEPPPVLVQARIKKAQEIVATRRANG